MPGVGGRALQGRGHRGPSNSNAPSGRRGLPLPQSCVRGGRSSPVALPEATVVSSEESARCRSVGRVALLARAPLPGVGGRAQRWEGLQGAGDSF